MSKKPTTVSQYLATLPKDRRDALQAVRRVILDNLDSDCAEGIQYGMIGYFVPHSVYPPGYHCDAKQPLPYASIASQKNHMAIYLFCIYTSEKEQDWFREAWLKTGKKLDMGKSCVRFKKVEDLALDVLARAIKRTPTKKFIAQYEAAFGPKAKGKPAKKTTRKKVSKKKGKATAKKSATKKTGSAAKKTARKSATKRARPAAKRAARKTKKAAPKKRVARSRR